MRTSTSAPLTIALIGFDGIQSLDLIGPMEVFSKANTHCPATAPAYRVLLASPHGGDIVSNAGLRVAGTLPLTALPESLDTLIIAGGSEEGLRRVAAETDLLAWLQERAPRVRRVASVCTGAFVLAAAGLLRGRRAATHWSACDTLQQMWPDIQVDHGAIYTAEPPYYTSAGVTTGLDLCLALVEADCGPHVALGVARDLVLFMRRPGSQAQFSTALRAQAAASSRLSPLVAAILDDPTGDLSVPAMAARLGMSERTFVRRFREEIGETPARFVKQARVDRAKTLLETSRWPLARIAERSGFSSLDSLHRVFLKLVGVTPTTYRSHFGTRGPAFDEEG
ncbi:MAG: helix-turn-helix domain-containing protein [Halomonas sp.]|jgi:transcriptional regulator GlxA family with amidase domain|uniref:GlxA family transcriptional regulator n=1 Tax=Halomonas sp. MCCC 1A11057 TaxID=2733482 RepID=UPI001F200767|nr:helix-turn-helix domain-containing protein [Halomonas sp. MCCC 1A11057]MCE8032830.1 helix-turn-helix domain-containing protein [Halomonas sp. MCCC 1A11057]MDX5434702.1 helix-turn-helix domain-containing protein [Halomonas sp.]MDX5504120.1 helix-turn-helix domain-containing protein [Halomonas sp.]